MQQFMLPVIGKVSEVRDRVVSRAGFGLKFVKMFWANFGPPYKAFFITFRVTIFFFCDVHLLCSLRWLL